MIAAEHQVVEVETVSPDGYGHVSQNGADLRIPGAGPGDRLTIRVSHRSQHGKVLWGEIVATEKLGPYHRDPRCPHAWPKRGRCGGCPMAHLHIEYVAQVKVSRVRESLKECGLNLNVQWTPAPYEQQYRNRGHFVVGRAAGHAVVLGSFAPRSHELVTMSGCEIIRQPMAQLADSLQDTLGSLRVPVYPENNGLRYLSMRADPGGRVLLDLVVAGDFSWWRKRVIPILIAQEQFAGISYSVNCSEGNAMRISDSVTVVGSSTIIERVGTISLELGAGTFSQLNSEVAAGMYAWAAAASRAPQVVWDWYCGTGGLGLTVARAHEQAKPKVFGADSIRSSIVLAGINASRESIDAHYETCDLSRQLPSGWPAPNLVLLNPPRRGLDELVVGQLAELRDARLVYMSCNPSTFARDAATLSEQGWCFGEVQAFDMLPGTAHVELIASAVHRLRKQ